MFMASVTQADPKCPKCGTKLEERGYKGNMFCPNRKCKYET